MTIILLFISFHLVAQDNMKFRTTHFAYKYVDDQFEWIDWTDWEESRILINVDFVTERVYIYSEDTQTYDILYSIETEADNEIKFQSINKDNIHCTISFVRLTEDVYQIYVYYSDVAIVYQAKLLK